MRPVFSLFMGQSVRTEKLRIKKVKKKFFGGGKIFFFSEEPFFLGLKFEWNLSVNTKRSEQTTVGYTVILGMVSSNLSKFLTGCPGARNL